MSNPESAIATPPRPTLGTLIVGLVLCCLLSTYFFVDAILLREPVTLTNAKGQEYVMRLYDPLQTAPYLVAGGMRIVDAIQRAQEETKALKAEIADRAAREQAFHIEVAGLAEELAAAEQLIAELKIELLALPSMQKDALVFERSELGAAR